jgi:hypothetical protein
VTSPIGSCLRLMTSAIRAAAAHSAPQAYQITSYRPGGVARDASQEGRRRRPHLVRGEHPPEDERARRPRGAGRRRHGGRPGLVRTGAGVRGGRLTPELAAALAYIRPGIRLVAICTGGYLGGRPATTHRSSAYHFQRLFPTIKVDPDALFIDDVDALTSAGVAAGIDLCLHIVRRDHGTAVANEVARRSVVPPCRDGGQARYVQRPVPESQPATTTAARTWALGRLDRSVQLRDMAERESTSVRTGTPLLPRGGGCQSRAVVDAAAGGAE